MCHRTYLGNYKVVLDVYQGLLIIFPRKRTVDLPHNRKGSRRPSEGQRLSQWMWYALENLFDHADSHL